MIFTETILKGAYVIHPELMRDDRGGFMRTFCKKEFSSVGLDKEFVQFNHSFNVRSGTLRGLHYQESPHSESKLIRCIKGSVFDVIVDIRRSSPTFLKWCGVELSASNLTMIYIPEGFAHGFQTLEENSELLYHHTAFYQPAAEKGICFNDPVLKIQWPLEISAISEKDKNYPLLTNKFSGIEIKKFK